MALERKQTVGLYKNSNWEERKSVLYFFFFFNYLVYHMNERGKKNYTCSAGSLLPTKQKDVCILSYALHEKYHANDLPLEFISPLWAFQLSLLDVMKSSWAGELSTKAEKCTKTCDFFLFPFKGFLLFAQCHISPVYHGWSRGKLVLLCQGRRRDENAACCGWGGAGRVCCCLCTDSDSYARIPPQANRIKRIPTREGLRALMAAPMHLLQNPNSGWKEERRSKAAAAAAAARLQTQRGGLWNSSNPVSLDRYWQSLMRSRVWSLQLPTNLYVCVTARVGGPAEATLCLNKPVFMRHRGEETSLLLFHREVLSSGTSVPPGHIHHFKRFIVTEALASHFSMQLFLIQMPAV